MYSLTCWSVTGLTEEFNKRVRARLRKRKQRDEKAKGKDQGRER